MAFSKRLFILLTFGTIAGVVGCSEDNQTDAKGDGGRTVADIMPLPGVNLMPNAEGFMETGKNTLGIQGAWYSFGCAGAVIEPREGAQFNNPGKMCFKGTAPMVTDKDGNGELDYSTIWGAGIGFDLCAESAAETADAGSTAAAPTKHPLGTCKYNAALATKMLGVAVRFSGVVNAIELRIQFNEGDSVANSYYKVTPADVAAGTVMNVEFEDPLVKTHYRPNLKPGDTDANNVLAIQFMVPTNSTAPVDWDFCVEAISAMTEPSSGARD